MPTWVWWWLKGNGSGFKICCNRWLTEIVFLFQNLIWRGFRYFVLKKVLERVLSRARWFLRRRFLDSHNGTPHRTFCKESLRRARSLARPLPNHTRLKRCRAQNLIDT
jgi:hypothetical protein